MTTARPDLAKEMGFVGAKVPCPYGPSAGDAGFRKNVEFFAGWRAKVGPDFPLSLDCYMALTVPYAIKLGLALAPHGIKWMEEFLPPGTGPRARCPLALLRQPRLRRRQASAPRRLHAPLAPRFAARTTCLSP